MSNTTTTTNPPTTSSPTTSSISTTPPSSSATTVPTTTSTISQTPSTTTVPPSTTSSSVVDITSTITETPSATGGTGGPSIVTLTSTQTLPRSTSSSSSSSRTSSATSTQTAISASEHGGSGGLGSAGTIAIAVVIPIVVVAACVLFGLWFWRKRKAKKNAEELRKSEMAEYGYNPNNDPTLPAVGAAYTDTGSEAPGDGGYRGWGTTSSNTRKPSTTLGSNSRHAAMAGIGMAYSETNSQPGGYGYHHATSTGNGQPSEQYPGDHVGNGRNEVPDGVGTLGVAAAGAAGGAAARNRNSQVGVQRGSSNASSAYSGGRAQSDSSGELPHMPGANYYQDDTPYNVYHDVQPGHGPYGDGTYGAGADQPVIRDVAARRNTRIERAPTFPQTQGGIAQNF